MTLHLWGLSGQLPQQYLRILEVQIGAVAINMTVSAVATRLLVTLRCLNVRGSRSR